jgi:hypothetical protein
MTDLLLKALDVTGFVKCEFEPDNHPCEHCGKKQKQLYFGNRDYWDSREGDYYCADCVIDYHQNSRPVRVLGGTIRENPNEQDND